jgi:ABC-type multidrug transport system ATPase subunit
MAVVTLPLPSNVLHTEPQILEFDKIATFIGGNGSGKSTILKSIFDEKLKGSEYQSYKVVCFSSGQNESYSEPFAKHLNKERLNKKALSLDCFYYDKSWSKLLIFLATTSKHNGFVRSFLRENSYVIEGMIDEDQTTKLSFKVKVDLAYTNIVAKAIADEEKGEVDVITKSAYHQTLHNFINALLDTSYDFSKPLETKKLQLVQDKLSDISFETEELASFDSKILFFTQAADNDYFIIKESFELSFVNKMSDGIEEILYLEDLSDGEYQLLFLYALVDLFDTQNTLFLLDEADSHLHYRNISKLWDVFNSIQGKAITTTHLLDSISKSGINKLRVIENGQIREGNKIKYLASRLNDLTEINNTQLKTLSLAKNIVFIDDENDWNIFQLLAVKKLSNCDEDTIVITENLNDFIAVKQESGYEKKTQIFGESKLKRLENFACFLEGHTHNTRNVFLICDRDELNLTNISTEKCDLLVQGDGIRKFNKNKLTSHLLSWKRREIKHYLLSPTALEE